MVEVGFKPSSWLGSDSTVFSDARCSYDRAASRAFTFLSDHCKARSVRPEMFIGPTELDFSNELSTQGNMRDCFLEDDRAFAVGGLIGLIVSILAISTVAFCIYCLRTNHFWWDVSWNWLAPIMLLGVFSLIGLVSTGVFVQAASSVRQAVNKWVPDSDRYERLAMSGWLLTDVSLVVMGGIGPSHSLSPSVSTIPFVDIGTARIKEESGQSTLVVRQRDGSIFSARRVFAEDRAQFEVFLARLNAGIKTARGES